MNDALTQRVTQIVDSRKHLIGGTHEPVKKAEGEGGCGVLGLASTLPIPGRHLHRPLNQMCNRGNGKGGGIAAVGLDPVQLGVDRKTLDDCYLIQIACLDPEARGEAEARFLEPAYDLVHASKLASLADFREVEDLEVEPPVIWRYFARPRPEALERFAEERSLTELPEGELADEFVFQTSYGLNQALYASLGEKRAFVLCHGKDMLVMKIVGFAEQVIRYYRLEDTTAHVWIGHQRYPTKGRVWHPGGAHPFVGLNEALVHNGDFANYTSICEYLAQRNLAPLYLTDTEVAVLLFDLWSRTYRYPAELLIESLAPTTELDFDRLSEDKQHIYRTLQSAHIHGSPDGPWFFIVARNGGSARGFELLGITDTSMLRPQVFAIHDGPVQIGLIGSERQAIDALLEEVSVEDERVCPVADVYWNARGGSHTDGGAFAFSVEKTDSGLELICRDKFDRPVSLPPSPDGPARGSTTSPSAERVEAVAALFDQESQELPPEPFLAAAHRGMEDWDYSELDLLLQFLSTRCRASEASRRDRMRGKLRRRLLALLNRRTDTGRLRPNWRQHRIEAALSALFDTPPTLGAADCGETDRRLDSRLFDGIIPGLPGPDRPDSVLYIDASLFPPEGDRGVARAVVEAYKAGWKHQVLHRCRGQRFVGAGVGPASGDLTIDVVGRSGDYLASGLDGANVVVHGSGQDQLGQILTAGQLVIHGDVGQAFMYGAKGGRVFVLGNAAGRPLINAVGCPKVVINGTCLDYLAESFMAGDPLSGGGYVVLNGFRIDNRGQVHPLDAPYPGSNLFSLASGGALYVRDPLHKLDPHQLNGGRFGDMTDRDWNEIHPLLQENEGHFGIPVHTLLTVDGQLQKPQDVYRKIVPIRTKALEGH